LPVRHASAANSPAEDGLKLVQNVPKIMGNAPGSTR
jgi:hypothetical protein